MADSDKLKKYNEIPFGGAIPFEEAGHPKTGSWRTSVKPKVDLKNCVNCLLCWVNCPDAAIVLNGTDFYGVDYDYCKGCELCEEVCPTNAIKMVNEEESLPEFGRIEDY